MVRRCRPLLGTFVEVQADGEAAVEAAFDAIARVHALMSAHEPESDVCRVNRFGRAEVHPWTAEVLRRARFWAEASDGAFDIVRAGQQAIASGYLPRHCDQPVPAASGWQELEIEGRHVRLARPGCIDPGGIAKGFAVDRAVAALRDAGATRGLVNAGGDLRAFGPEAWTVQVADPHTRAPLLEIAVQDQALATSAILEGSAKHLPGADPRWISATVRAPACIDADALTKILLSGSPAAAPCLAFAHAEGLRLAVDGTVEPVAEPCPA